MAEILIVENEEDIAELLKLELESKDHNVTVCHDGDSAIESLKQHKYGLIILDLFLPKKNGAEVSFFIRDVLPPDKNTTPIICITGGNIIMDADESAQKIRHFVNAVIQKPVDYNVFHQAVEKFL